MSRRDAKVLIFDAREAIDFLVRHTSGRSRNDYLNDPVLMAAVERKYEVLGEALSRLHRDHPTIFELLPDARCAVDLRNRIAHGYEAVDHFILWDTVSNDLPRLRQALAALT